MSGYRIISVDNSTHPEIENIRKLFLEYAASRNFDGALGDFDSELKELPGAYGPDSGMLLLASRDTTCVGCVAYRKIGQGVCEMKRLYVIPAERRSGLGRKLVVELIERATKNNYRFMKLDTHPGMMEAKALYESLGFTPCEPYNKNPIKGIMHFELLLNSDS